MLARLSLALSLVSGFAYASTAPDGGPVVKDYQSCASAACSSDIVARFNTDKRSLSGNTVYGESFYVEAGAANQYKTLFPPTRIVRIYNPATGEEFKPSIDYRPTGQGFELLPQSGMARAPAGFSNDMSDEDRTSLGVKVSQEFQKFQYAVTYEKSETYTPVTYGSLPRLAGMIGKKPLKVTFFGDSITEGGDASGVHSLAPGQPGYAELVMAYLNSKYPGMWQSRNNSVGGWAVKEALNAADYRLTDKESDLVVLGFAMNDSGTVKTEKYERRMKELVETLRSAYPQASILLLSSTVANPQSPVQKPQVLASNLKSLREMTEDYDNVMLVDATSIWRKLLENKSFNDITGNGFNHPNDFGHRLLAESVISALVGPDF